MTKVKMLKQTFWGTDEDPNIKYPAMTYFVGQVADIPEVVAARWIKRGIAVAAVKPIPVENVEPLIEPEGRHVPGMKELTRKQGK